MQIDRQRCIASSAALAAAASTSGASGSPDAREIPKRRLGRTYERVSIVGMGGFHIGKPDIPDADAIEFVHRGVDRGITFLDDDGWVARSAEVAIAIASSR